MIAVLQHKKRTFFGIASFQALAMFRRGLFYSYLSIYLRFFLGLSVTETTLFATFPMILNIVFQTFVWGVLSDKYQKRRTYIILGEVFAGISTVVVWWLHTLPASKYSAGYIIILGLSFVEIFWSMSNIGWSAIISDLYPEQSRTNVQGMLASIGAIGRLVGVWIGGIAYDGLARYYEGWGFHSGVLFFIASGVMLLSTIPMFFVPEGGIGKKEATERNKKGNIFALSKPFLIFLLAMLFINFGKNSIAIIKTQYLVLDQGFNVSSSLLSHIVNMRSLAILVFGLLITRLTRRFNDTILLYGGIFTALLYLLGFAFIQNLLPIFIANFFGGISDVIVLAASYSYVSRLIPPEKRGKQFALFNATFFLSWGVAGTLIAGPIVDLMVRAGASQVLSYQISFLSAACLVIIGSVVFFFANRIVKKTGISTGDV